MKYLNSTKWQEHTPYKGLMPYFEEDALFFFGREKDRKTITNNLIASRLTILYGASGVGKSSVLQAGVAYHLRQIAKQNLKENGTPEFAVIVFKSWQDDPVAGLIKQVEADIKALYGNNGLEPIPKSPQLDRTLQAWTERIGGENWCGKLFIILDQFEEYFLYHAQDDGEEKFAVEFPRAINSPVLDVNFLISIREDSLSKLDRFEGSIPNLFDNYLRIEHLDEKSASDAIRKPVKEYCLRKKPEEKRIFVEPKLVKEVLDQVQTNQILLREKGRGHIRIKSRPSLKIQIETPYLQLVMTRLWEEEMGHGSHRLQLQTFVDLGGAEQIIKYHLNNEMKLLEDEKGKAAVKAMAKVFQYLVTPSGYKIVYPVPDLAKHTELDEKQLKDLLEAATRRGRILRRVGPLPNKPDIERYEIFHDVLAQPILQWRQQYLQDQKLEEKQQQVNLTIKKGLPIQSLRQQRRRQDELAALLARQAFLFSQQEPKLGIEQQEIDETLRAALGVPFFSTILSCGQSGISSVAFSPKESKILAAGSFDGSIRIWNLSDISKPVIFTGHTKSINSIAFNSDGQILVSGSNDGIVKLWNLQQNVQGLVVKPQQFKSPALKPENQDREIPVLSVAFSPKESKVASGNADGSIYLWDLNQPDAIPKKLKGHRASVGAIAFSPDGKMLASGGGNYMQDNRAGRKDYRVGLWDLQSPTPSFQKLYQHEGDVWSVTFRPDGKALASCSEDKTIRLYELNQKNIITRFISTVLNFVIDASISFQNLFLKLFVLLGWTPSNQIKLSETIRIFTAHEERIRAIAFSPNGNWLASASDDQTIRLWDLTLQNPEPKILRGHSFDINSVAFSSDGNILASGSQDNSIRLWDLKSPPIESRSPLKKHTDKVLTVAFSQPLKNGDWLLASGSRDKTARIWKLSQGDRLPKSFPIFISRPDRVTSVAFSPDGNILAIGSADASILLWDIRKINWIFLDTLRGRTTYTYDLTSTIEEKQNNVRNEVTSITFISNNSLIAGNKSGQIIVLKTNQPDAKPIFFNGHEQAITSVAFHPKKNLLASGSYDQTIRLWDLSQPDEKPIFLKDLKGHSRRICSVSFSPDGKLLASASNDWTVRLWNLNNLNLGDTQSYILKGHNAWVSSVAFSSNGRILASGSYDQSIRLWDLSQLNWSEPKREISSAIILEGHEQSVMTVAFSPDGKTLASGAYDKTVRLWNVITDTQDLANMVCKKVLRNLTLDEWNQFIGTDIDYVRTCPDLPSGKGVSKNAPPGLPTSKDRRC